MAGYYLMHRGWMDNPVFQRYRGPYCERAAWIWLIEHALYEPSKVKLGGKLIELQRGQLSYSYRYLAAAWGWSEAKVRRWCVGVASAEMIRCDSDAGQVVITICNYNKYQIDQRVADAATGASLTQHRRSIDAAATQIRKKEKEVRDRKEPNGSSLSPPIDPNGSISLTAGAARPSDFDQFWKVYPKRVGKDAARRKYEIARRTAAAEELLAAAGRYAASVAGIEDDRFVAHPATWLHQGRWQDEDSAPMHDAPTEPPPTLEDLGWTDDLEEARH